ncbi:MAG TPA: rRNA maturation RNase YbeY, partial [Firmicutes bacterium]|nr:rRNA maturation RNase YbeY [Bacillota bacterium]
MALHISVKGRVLPDLLLIKTSRSIYRAYLAAEKLPPASEVSLLYCDNSFSRYLNGRYRKKNSPTDVLSFPQYENREEIDREKGETVMLGDVVISLEKAGEQAKELGHSLR